MRYDTVKVGWADGHAVEAHDKGLIRAANARYTPPQDLRSDPECTVFVGRLSLGTTEDMLKQAFGRFGRIQQVHLVRDIVTGLTRGYTFIEYKTPREADLAYERGHRMILDEKRILVDYERSRSMRDWRPRRLGGGFGGRKESGQLRFGGRDRPFTRHWRP